MKCRLVKTIQIFQITKCMNQKETNQNHHQIVLNAKINFQISYLIIIILNSFSDLQKT
jgi:hypothetical protein